MKTHKFQKGDRVQYDRFKLYGYITDVYPDPLFVDVLWDVDIAVTIQVPVIFLKCVPEKENQMEQTTAKSKRDFFTTYRYFRRPHGAMSAACVVHKETDDTYTITFGLSFCNPTDMFSRKIGRGLALERLMSNPIIIKKAENIAGAIIKYVKENWLDERKEESEIFGVKNYNCNSPIVLDKAMRSTFLQWADKFVEEL